MKRYIALLLLCVLAFTACTGNNSSNTSQESQPQNNSDASQTPDTSTPNDTSSPEEMNKEPEDVIVSLGKSYIVSAFAADEYPDTFHCELTNGTPLTPVTSFSDTALSGYTVARQTVTIDLEQVYDSIHTISASYFLYEGSAVSTSLTITAQISADKKKWTDLGELKNDNPVIGSLNTAKITSEEYLTARYVRFIVTGNNTWKFLEELSVTAFTVPQNKISYINQIESAYQTLGVVNPPKSGNKIDKTLLKTPVSLKCPYKYSQVPNVQFPDKGSMLTDGVATGVFGENAWVGFDGGDDVTIKIDLKETVTDIAGVDISCHSNTALKSYLPAAISVTAIDNKSNSQPIGIIYGSHTAPEGGYTFSLQLENTVSARYIAITLHTIPDTTQFVEEITVYSYRAAEENSFYPPAEIQEGISHWESPTDVYQNLLLNKPHQIHINSDLDKEYYQYNSPVTDKQMTDGEFSEDHNIHNGKFYKFCLGQRRRIVYDLQHISAIDKFTASFSDVSDWSVYVPSPVSVIISSDGKNWYKAGELTNAKSNIANVAKAELILPQKLKARYVVFAFDIVSWVGIDELQVFGTQSLNNAADPAPDTLVQSVSVNQRIEPSPDILGGAKDVCLLYHASGYAGHTVESLMPYVSYVDKEGNPTDIMFDSFLFLYTTGDMPSGGSAYKSSVKSDWEWCINDLFTPNKNLYALEEAASVAKNALSLPNDYKYKVCLTIYNPTPDTTNFGDVDGDGVSENMSVYENRVKVIKWYVAQLEEKFDSANFQNIELVGYYWWDEYINYADPNGEQLVKDTSDIVHSTGKDFCWIPWFVAPGYDMWERVGFDIACMQPNYVFSLTPPYSNITNTEKFTKMYGMGVEMEVWESCLSEKVFFERYMEYITAGANYGYMNDTVCMYYQSMSVFGDAARSTNLMARTLYDTTYHFIKGDVQPTPKRLEDITFTAEKNKVFTGKIQLPEDKLHEIVITSLPDNGFVTIDENGNFAFFPQKDFTGSVTFGFVYSEYLNFSEETTVTINVQ